jgi:hypothetical protein
MAQWPFWLGRWGPGTMKRFDEIGYVTLDVFAARAQRCV